MTCTGTTCNQGRAECRDGCTRLHTENSDGTSPHDETRDLIELALDGLLAFALIGALVFVVFTAIGFWSAR